MQRSKIGMKADGGQTGVPRTSMRLAAATLLIYSALILGAGLVAYLASESMASLIAAVVVSFLLLYLAFRAFRGSVRAGYVSGVFTFLLAIYFAYRFLATERFIPSGGLLIVSFIALFGVILGVFLGLRERL